MDENLKKEIARIVEYMWADERRSAEEYFGESQSLDGHIFSSLVAVDNWLKGTQNAATDYIET